MKSDSSMSWFLTLDRAKRGGSKPVSYNDKNTWKSILKEPEEEEPKDAPPKKKRGRPPRSATPEKSKNSDAFELPKGQKKRGRPPKSRPSTPVPASEKKDPDYVKQPARKRRGRPPGRKPAIKEEMINENIKNDSESEYEYYDYVYEYEYDYEDEDEEKEKEQIQQENTSVDVHQENVERVDEPQPSPVKPQRQKSGPKSRPKQQVSEPEMIRSEGEMYVVQKILGIKDQYGVASDVQEFFVKFRNRSYRHCQWMTRDALLGLPDGEMALKIFMTQSEKSPLYHSHAIPSLLVLEEKDVHSMWFDVERVIHETVDASGHKEYLCKWKGLEYDMCTLESEENIHNSMCIAQWQERMKHKNPRVIADSWVHPKPEDYAEITEKLISKSGEVMCDFQLEGLNWLRKCWYEGRHSIIGDESRAGKAVQAVAMLVYLSQKYGIRGPFLILSTPGNVDYWQKVVDEWSDLNSVVFSGNTSSRQIIADNEFDCFDDQGRPLPEYLRADVVITTYDLFLNCYDQYFDNIVWRYVIGDDGDKMKNSRSRVRTLLTTVPYEHMTLLMEQWQMTKPVPGMQKNITNIFYILNFLSRKDFMNINEFMQKYPLLSSDQLNPDLVEVINQYVLERSTAVIEEQMEPKREVLLLCQPSEMQTTMYRDAVKQKTDIFLKPITDEADIPLITLIQVLRKICNHPCLVSNVIDDSNKDESLVKASGKLVALDKLLPMCLSKDGKIVIFSQMVRVLDVLEDYMSLRSVGYAKVDSSMPFDVRCAITEEFKNSECRVLLVCARPDGYVLPLDIADTIIVYDNDSYVFPAETKATIFHFVIEGSFEMALVGPESAHLCFDTVMSAGSDGPALMDAQDIELILRNSIWSMFKDTTPETIQRFIDMSVDDMLGTCVREIVAHNEAIVNIGKQKEFWTSLLDLPQKKIESAGGNSATKEFDIIKKLSQSINDKGLRDGAEELDLVKCALILAEPKDPKVRETLNAIVGDNSSDDAMRFAQSYFLVEKHAPKLFESVIFFHTLPKVLYCATLPELVWPSVKPLWKDAGCEYALLYSVALHGFRRSISSAFESDEIGLADANLTRPQAEKRAATLVQKIIQQFPDVVVPDDFEPVPPTEWRAQHADLIKRTTITDEEVIGIYHTMQSFGVPHLPDHNFDMAGFAARAKLDDVSNDAVEAVVEDIISVALGIKNESSEPNYEDYELAKPISAEATQADLMRLVLVCRLMESVYAFAEDFKDIANEKSFEFVKIETLPEWWTPEHSRALITGLYASGCIDVASWSVFTSDQVESVLPTVESRLRLASVIISQVRGLAGLRDPANDSYIVKPSSKLSIESFGKIIKLPEFREHKYLYPVGFISERMIVKNIPGLPQVWYRCEIQAIGSHPIFVVSAKELDNLEFVELTPMDAWTSMIEFLIGEEAASEVLKKLKLSGEWLFGLDHSLVTDKIHAMAKSNDMHISADESQSDESDDGDFKA